MGISIQSQQDLAQELAHALYAAGRKLAEEFARRSSKPGQPPVQPKYKDVVGALVNEAKKAFMFYRAVCRTTAQGKYKSALKSLLEKRANSQSFGNTPRNEREYYEQLQQSLAKLLDTHPELKNDDQDLLAVFGWAVRIAEYYQQHPPQDQPQRRQQLQGKGTQLPATSTLPGPSSPANQPVDPERRIVNEFVQRVQAVASKDASGVLPNLANQLGQLHVSDTLKREAAQLLKEKAEQDIGRKKLEGKKWYQKLCAFLESGSLA